MALKHSPYFITAFSLIALSEAASAGSVTPFARLGADVGGDNLVTVVYYDGYEEKTNAGDGVRIEGGAIFSHSRTWESSLGLAYKVSGSLADNGELTWSSWPLELMTYSRSGQWRTGIGVNFVMNPKMESDGVLEGLDVEFKDASGFVFEADWSPKHSATYLGLRFNVIEFETESGTSVNGNNLGLVLGFRVP